MSFNIAFDYRFDGTDYFADADRRAVLERAADIWENLILDEFDDVPVGTTFTVDHPSNSGIDVEVTLESPIDDLLIFVGSENIMSLATGSYDGVDAVGDVFDVRVDNDFRGQGPVTNFEPWTGTITVDRTTSFSYDLDEVEAGKDDFLTVILHEIGHILGFGTSPAFRALIAGTTTFAGVNATALNGGVAVPLDGRQGHFEDGFADDSTLLDPRGTLGARQMPSQFDLAVLADIGYEINGFTTQGSTPALVTQGNDVTVYGTILDDVIDGLGGDDQLQGDRGNDTVLGNTGNDTVFGQEGNDDVRGGAGDDQVQGNDGNDTVFGGAGNDLMFGQHGDDTLYGNQGQDNIQGGSGHDRIYGGDGNDRAAGGTGSDVLQGMLGDDILIGNEGEDTIAGGEGRDRLFGNEGNDRLFGSGGDDLLSGGLGDDTLRGGDGVDTIMAGAGNDVIVGGDTAADLRDLIFGEDGNDNIDGGYGNDSLNGGAGNDSIAGGFGVDTIVGNDGNDVITGSAFSDLIFGGAGVDFVNGGFGNDRLNGGDDGDLFYHLGIRDHGNDWIQDFDSAQGDILLFGRAATADQFQVNTANTANAGLGAVDEAFVIYRPSGQIIWALVDGAGQDAITLRANGVEFDLDL